MYTQYGGAVAYISGAFLLSMYTGQCSRPGVDGRGTFLAVVKDAGNTACTIWFPRINFQLKFNILKSSE